MTGAETAWVAGILEGEGCFDFNAGSSKYPRVRVEMKDEDVIRRLHALIGGRVSHPKKRNARPNWAPTTLLVVNGRDKVEPLLNSVLPWMGWRRAAKIRELLSSYAADTEMC